MSENMALLIPYFLENNALDEITNPDLSYYQHIIFESHLSLQLETG